MRESKAQYIQFCHSNYVPMQLQPWWLDAVCTPESWDVAIAKDAGGNMIGVLPWFKKRRWGLPVVQMPPLSTYAGPWLLYPETPGFKLQSRYTFEKKVCTDLIKQLPETAFFLQNFRPELTNWLPFYWEGFRQSTRYTYVFDQIKDPEEITAGMKNTLRSDMKKAAQVCEYHREDQNWETVYRLNTLSYKRKGHSQPYNQNTFQRLHHALALRGQTACFIARDRISGAAHAGLYLIYDQQQAAVLMTGTDPVHKASCAIYGLFMEAIKFSALQNLSLDFEGSMQPEIEHTFRAFGARQQPYFQVRKAGNRFFELIFNLTRP